VYAAGGSRIYDGHVYEQQFSLPQPDKTYELCKESRDGLKCHAVSEHSPLGQILTFDRVWGLLLTSETDRYLARTRYSLKVFYGGGVKREGLLTNEYLAAPMSSVKMKTRFVFAVQADGWHDFVLSLEEWASRFNIQLVHDYV
jgi:hypothetical protein